MITALVIALATCLVVGISMGFNAVGNIFFTCLYAIARWFLIAIDFMQSLVRKLCGLDDKVGDVLFDTFIRSSEVKIALLAILALSVFLVFGFAMVQIIRLQYTTEGGKNAVGPLVKTCLKSIFLFCLIPFTSFLGVYVSNQLLKAVDAATSTSGSTSIAGRIFKISAKDANPYRSGEVEWVFVGWNHVFDVIIADVMPGGDTYDRDTGIYKKKSGYTNEGERKVYIDGNNISGSNYVGLKNELGPEELDNIFAQRMEDATKVSKSDAKKAITLKNGDLLNFSDFDSVYYFYNIGKINYFVLFLCGWYLFKTLITILFGLVMRIYKVSILFIISPYPVALTVLDNGSALNKWKGKYLAELFSAYGTIAGLNLFITLLPIIEKIKLYDGSAWYISLFNDFVQLIFLLVGCLMIKDIVGIISEFVGGGNVLSQGEGMQKQVGDIAKKAGSAAVGVAIGGYGLAKQSAGAWMARIDDAKMDSAVKNKDKNALKAEAAADKLDEEAEKSLTPQGRKDLDKYNDLQTQIDTDSSDLKNLENERENILSNSDLTSEQKLSALQAKDKEISEKKSNIKANSKKQKKLMSSDSLQTYFSKKKQAGKKRQEAFDWTSGKKWEDARDSFFQHQRWSLQGNELAMRTIGDSKIVSSFNKATKGVFTSKNRQDIDKAISGRGEDEAAVMTGWSKAKQNRDLGSTKSYGNSGIPVVDKNGNVRRDKNGNIITQDVSKNTKGLGYKSAMSGRVARAANYETTKEYGKQVEAVLDEKALNGALDRLKDMIANAKEGTLSEAGIDNLIVNRSEFEDTASTFGGADAAKQVKEIIDNLERSKNTDDKTLKAKLIGDAQNSAKKIDVNAMAKISPESIAQLKEAIKNGTMYQSLANKNYGSALTEVVRKAVEKASAHTQNVKNDPKTENIIPQLLRELLDETRKKK